MQPTWAWLVGFLVSWQTIFILRPGILWGRPWPLATIGVQVVDLMLLGFAVRGARQCWRAHRRTSWGIAGCVMLLAASNSWVSADRALTIVGWLRIAAFLLAWVGMPREASWRRGFLGGCMVAIVLHALFGIVQFFTGHAWASTMLGMAYHGAAIPGDAVLTNSTERWLRAYGGFPHPNVLGTALVIGMAVWAQWYSHVRRLVHIGIWWCVFLLMQAALLVTFSRAAWGGYVILTLLLARQRATRFVAVMTAVQGVVLVGIFAMLIAPRFRVAGTHELRSLVERGSGIQDARMLIARAPWWGVGLHAMPSAVARVRFHDPQPVHHVPLLLLAEVGMVGALFFGWLLWKGRRAVRWWPMILVLLPTLAWDHHLWSLPSGLMLLFVCVIAWSSSPSSTAT
ncbi:O-antigen ligase family protein [Candidatus Uhrbacteria bacterium]|nr:O-antigen ligase family protein [Candidatus Uhrbacteria bacterium]